MAKKIQKTKEKKVKLSVDAQILGTVKEIYQLLKSHFSEKEILESPKETFNPTVSQDGRFVDLGNGIIKDTKLRVMWAKEGSEDSMVFEDAEKYCKKADLGGFKDWRLPTVEELSSIVDYAKYNPAINPIFKCKSEWYWSSTKRASYSGLAWIVLFFNGGVFYDYLGGYSYVRPVRQY